MLFFVIQDFYLAEVRGNGRIGEVWDYGGDVAIGGTYFVNQSSYIISELRRWRQRAIKKGDLRPSQALRKAGMEVKIVRWWTDEIRHFAENLDPMENWHPFLRYIDYSKRRKLKFDALLAQDFYEMADILAMFLRDMGEDYREPTLLDWVDPSFEPASRSEWQVRRYGREALGNPYQMLEFLANDFGVNPKPMAIVFTEGEEWAGIKKLYEHFGFPPALLGVEFRSIGGEGNFSLANWQCFIEYMHEKQVLMYFLLDKEGRAAREAFKLQAARRKFKSQFLEKVIPENRIVTWKTSFEEDNFTDAEISRALAIQEVTICDTEVHAIREESKRMQGLINAICASLSAKIDKRLLVMDLVDLLIKRRRGKSLKGLRPVERFVLSSGEFIALNHQPTCEESKRRNLQSGFLG